MIILPFSYQNIISYSISITFFNLSLKDQIIINYHNFYTLTMPKYAPKPVLKKKKGKNRLQFDRITSPDIILYGINNERSVRIMEKDNTLTFRCRNEATKTEIRKAFLELYGEKIDKINTVNTVKGYKKAYVRLSEQGVALKVASEKGIL